MTTAPDRTAHKPAPTPLHPVPDTTPQPGPTTPSLTPAQKKVVAAVAVGVAGIAAIGFAGSYHAVTELAATKGFGNFARFFTLGVDIGIAVFLGLDLLLAWLRMPYPLLRHTAWLLTAATVIFNAASAWPDKLGAAMHGVIPILFIGSVEAARHAVGRIADITADRHIENPPIIRWLVAPASTFYIWRRMRKWNIRTYREAIRHQKEVKVYRARLRQQYGRVRKAPADKLLVLTLAGYGMSIAEAEDLPRREAAARSAEEHRAEMEAQQATEARRLEEEAARAEAARIRAEAEAEQARLAEESRRIAEEADRERRLAQAREQAELRRLAEEADAARRLREAEAAAQRQALAEQQRAAALKAQADAAAAQAEIDRLAAKADADRRIEAARAQAEEQRLANALRDEERKQREANERKAAEERRRAEVQEALANANHGTANPTRTGTSANPEPQNQNRDGTTNQSAAEPERNREPRTANPTGTANQPKANRRTANPANLSDRAANKRNQLEQVLELIAELGYDAATLTVVMDRTGMSKTTAYHRLTEARGIWNQRKAS